MMIRAVLFDWSGTLFDDIFPLPELIAAAAGRVGRPTQLQRRR
jgi:beta-phosphoglucomutase-like phosphatase (HAD superfamily)